VKRLRLERVLTAGERLRQVPIPRSGKLLVGFFALKSRGVNTHTPTVVTMADFVDVCEHFFGVREAPDPERPYFTPHDWEWKDDNWPRGSVATRWQDTTPMRKTGAVLVEGQGDNNRTWRFAAPLYLDALKNYVTEGHKIPLVELAVWYYRYESLADTESVAGLAHRFVAELSLSGDEVAILFDATPSDEDDSFGHDWHSSALAERLPPPDAGAAAVNGGTTDEDEELEEEAGPLPAAIEPPTDDALVASIVSHMRETGHFDVSAAFIRNVLAAMRSDRFVVLVGKPGTGKTRFVQLFARALDAALAGSARTWLSELPVSEETAEYDLIGFRDLAGTYVPSRVLVELNRGDANRDVYLLLLDEANLASLDVYAARVVAALTNRIPIPLAGKSDLEWAAGSSWTPPVGMILFATINSYLEDPSRRMLSTPVKRRANVISMPDRLAEIAADGGDEVADAFRSIARDLLQQVADDRKREGASVMMQSLDDRLGVEPEAVVLQTLWRLSRLLTTQPEIPISLGVIQSMLVYCALSDDSKSAIDHQIEQKLLPLLRGDAAILDAIREYCGEDFPRSRAQLDRLDALAAENAGRLRPLA
jgi:hypothetical protein